MTEETQRILRERAAALAATVEDASAADTVDVVAFALAHETYAIESAFVREICALTDLTPLPCTPPFVLGIASVRGEILSVIDIRQFFDLPAKGLTDLNRIVVLRFGDMTLAILADAILGVRQAALAELQPSLPTLTGIREKYLKGVTPDRTIVLDAAKLLGDEGLVVREQVEP
ncbi:MAG TPA: chemotaxis protein CheW [Thermoanaerobaculia bacterium]|nr:chemotaxis protein CheW [Thermoanaerobaculia bacterium]